jgi:hypothetical protein
MKRILPSLLLAAAGILSTGLAPAAGQCETREIHGADSSFRTGAIGICWGMLRGAAGSDVQVVIRIRLLSEGGSAYSDYAVQAVHPLTQAAEWVVPRRSLEKVNTAAASRESFKNMAGRRIYFYRPSASEPELAVYYMGIPDTTPELTDPAQLEQYFDLAFKRLAQRQAP